MLYRWLIRPLLYLLPAEAAHLCVVAVLRVIQIIPGGLSLIRKLFPTPLRPVQAMGLTFPSPIGLAAGFDKNAEVYRALFALGFGFVEVGTITALGQPGNPKPRLFRLIRDRALINRMGFNNHGAQKTVPHLARLRQSTQGILGINIGKTKIVSPEDAVSDYQTSTRTLGRYADYFVVNVSSPNTPGLRDLQAIDALRPILQGVRATLDEVVPQRRVPLLVKIAPDLSDEDIVAVAQLAVSIKLDGIIATNTTVSRSGLTTPEEKVQKIGAGGLSGAPLKDRALAVIRLLRQHAGPELVLIAAGGIENAKDAKQRLDAGANLVQIYSALVYEGPRLPSKMCHELEQIA